MAGNQFVDLHSTC
uniref:Uncharacterized protein n=1 Tax=Arundo donax TaxID=35708 RepID=A0A0A9A934_ARUDO